MLDRSFHNLTLEQLRLIDAAFDVFEAEAEPAEQLDVSRVSAQLATLPEELRAHLFREIIEADLLRREALGEHVEREEYDRLFPDYRDTILEVFTARMPRESRANESTITDGESSAPEALHQIAKTVLKDLLQESDSSNALGRIGVYEVRAILGAGGMGVVLDAWDSQLSRRVAIKVLAPHLSSSPRARARFLHEARAAGSICHPNVVGIYSIDDQHDPPMLVLEHIDGKSLADILQDSVPLQISRIVEMAIDVTQGLRAAHAVGLVHRDLKPGNILVDSLTGRAVVSDFGLSRAIDNPDLTANGELLGTPRYMSPEQIEGAPVDQRSDLFSLGTVLYRMLTGTHAFPGRKPITLVRQICDTTPAPVKSIRSDAPKWLCALTEQLLEKDPDARPQSANDVIAVLNAGEHAGNGHRRLRRVERLRRTLRSMWLPGTVVAIPVLLGMMFYFQPNDDFANGDAFRTEADLRVVPPVRTFPAQELETPAFSIGVPCSLRFQDGVAPTIETNPESGWSLLQSFPVNGKVRTPEFSPHDDSLWFQCVSDGVEQGVYRIGNKIEANLQRAETPDYSLSNWRDVLEIRCIEHSSKCHEIAFSSDRQLVAMPRGGEGLVRIFDYRTGTIVTEFFTEPGVDCDPVSIVFLPSTYQGSVGRPGDLLTLDTGYPVYPGNIWKCVVEDTNCVFLSEKDFLGSPTDICASQNELYVCQRSEKANLLNAEHPNHFNKRLFRVHSDHFQPIPTERALITVNGMVYDPVTQGLIIATDRPTEIFHVDLTAESDVKPVTMIATGLGQTRSSCLDISLDGRFLAIADFETGCIHMFARGHAEIENHGVPFASWSAATSNDQAQQTNKN